MKRLITALLLLLTLSIFAVDKLPDLSLEDESGKIISLKELNKDKIVIIDFWGTFCQPCKKGIPAYDKVAEKYKDVILVTVCIDRPRSMKKAKRWIKAENLKAVSLYDKNGKSKDKFGFKNVPATYIIDKDGKIVYTHNSYKKGDEVKLEEEIKKLVK